MASGLSKAINCGVNDLPLSMVLLWYEQKGKCAKCHRNNESKLLLPPVEALHQEVFVPVDETLT